MKRQMMCVVLAVLALPTTARGQGLELDLEAKMRAEPAPGESAASEAGVRVLYESGYIPPDLTYGCLRDDHCPQGPVEMCRIVDVAGDSRDAQVTVGYTGVCGEFGACEIDGVEFEALCDADAACDLRSGNLQCTHVGDDTERQSCAQGCAERRVCADEDTTLRHTYLGCITGRGLCERQPQSSAYDCIEPLECLEDVGDCRLPSTPDIEDVEPGGAELKVKIAHYYTGAVKFEVTLDGAEALGLAQGSDVVLHLKLGSAYLAYGPVPEGTRTQYRSFILGCDEEPSNEIWATESIDNGGAYVWGGAVTGAVEVNGYYVFDVEAEVLDDCGERLLGATFVTNPVRLHDDLKPRECRTDRDCSVGDCREGVCWECDDDSDCHRSHGEDHACSDQNVCYWNRDIPWGGPFDCEAPSCTGDGGEQGCMEPAAENFNPDATVGDASCVYSEGCTDTMAVNYEPGASIDDGSCEYATGCTDPLATSYDVLAYMEDPFAVDYDPSDYVDDFCWY